MALGPKSHLFGKRRFREQLHDLVVKSIVKRRIDAMAGQDREPDFAKRRCKLRRERRFFRQVALQEASEVEAGNPIVLVELLALTARRGDRCDPFEPGRISQSRG